MAEIYQLPENGNSGNATIPFSIPIGFGGYGNGGMFGNGNNDWWILLLFLFGGYGGYGFGGGFGGYGGAGLQGVATRADINAGFQFQDIQNGIRGLERGLCDGFYNVNNSLQNGFNGVQQSINGVQHQISDCCCATQRAKLIWSSVSSRPIMP